MISCMSWSLMSSSPFDTVDRSILDCALGRLGLPGLVSEDLLFFSLSGSSQVQACCWPWGAMVSGMVVYLRVVL